jgi:NTE family protein
MLPSPVPKPDRHGPLPGQGGRRLALVLGGGNALGAYLAGAYERLHGAGLRPDLIVGASIGAVTGAILAGNPPARRLERLEAFWAEAALHTFGAAPAPAGLRGRQAYNGAHAALAAALGRPAIFGHRFPGLLSVLPGVPGDVALYYRRTDELTFRR